MKIVYCIAGTRHSGGMERVLANKANYLVNHGYEITIITTDQYGEKPFFELDKRIKCIDLAINYEENNGKSIVNKLLKYPIKQLKHKNRLTKVLEAEKADIVISMFCNEASILPKLSDGSVKILEVHFSRFKRLQYNRKGLWGYIDRIRSINDERIARRYRKFVVLSHEDALNWQRVHEIEVIPNHCSFKNVKRADINSHTVVAIGRLTHQKGFERLIEAWGKIKDHGDWKLRIIGNGPNKADLLTQINRLGLNESITIEDSIKGIELVYENSSIVALSSRYEGLPMILIEAQTFGIPIVSFRCKCGPSEIVSDGVDGYLVNEDDCEMLAKRLEEVMNDDTLRERMSEKALEASKRFSEQTIMSQWIELFNEITVQ